MIRHIERACLPVSTPACTIAVLPNLFPLDSLLLLNVLQARKLLLSTKELQRLASRRKRALKKKMKGERDGRTGPN